MSDRRILVASNRGPVTFVEEDGGLVEKRGSGGLVTALTAAAQETGGLWVAAAMTEGDRRRLARAPDGRIDVVEGDTKFRVRLLAFDRDVYERAYNTISNRLLWFLHHYLWDLPRAPGFDRETTRAWEAYRRFNGTFARALAEEAGDGDTAVLVQDYHLSLVPAVLRRRAPDARIAHFHHCPFAGPDYLRLLPPAMLQELLGGLLGADVLGFQTARWAASFLACCELLDGAEIDDNRVAWRGRETHVGVHPIAVDPEGLRTAAATPEVRRKRRDLERWRGDRHLVLRVDRAELSKNVLRGFLAFGELLRRHPEWRRNTVFLALLNPSRRSVPEYRAYTEECLAMAERINAELREPGWRPIEVRIDDDHDEVLAAYGLYDVLVVNAVFDGMNLVAKEGPVLNRRDGVLLLSRNAGAFAELGEHALAVDPIDVGGTGEALHEALTMPAEERAARARGLRRAAGAATAGDWVSSQLQDLDRSAG